MGKGSQFERDICRQLSHWWSDGDDDSLFWRSSNSGGRATVRGRKGKKTAGHYGDITATDNRGRLLTKFFVWELKRGYPAATVHGLLDRGRGSTIPVYLKWIEQAELSRSGAGAFGWVIVHKRDRQEPCVFLPEFAARKIMLGPNGMSVWEPSVKVWYGPTQCVVGMQLSKFFAAVTPEDVRQAYRRWKESK